MRFPGAPLVGLTLLMDGALTVNVELLLATLLTVTTTLVLPAESPLGTAAVMLVALHALTAAAAPPKVTVLDPCVEPKFVPVMVTDAPIGPDVGDKLLIVGADCAWPYWQRTEINSTRPRMFTMRFIFVSPAG